MSLQSFAAMLTLMFAHVHLYNLNVWLTMWMYSKKAMLLAASVSFLSTPVMLNPSRNSNRNKTSTRYKVIIQFWRLSIANQGKSNIDKNMCEPSNIHSFLLTKLQMLFSNLHPSPKYYTLTIEVWQLVIMTSTQIPGIKILVSKYQLSTSYSRNHCIYYTGTGTGSRLMLIINEYAYLSELNNMTTQQVYKGSTSGLVGEVGG